MKVVRILIPLLLLGTLFYIGYRKLPFGNAQVKTDPSFYEIKGKVIEGFPTDFPVYPGAKLEGSANVNPDDVPDEGYRVKWEVAKDVADIPQIMAWYQEHMTAYGWSFTPPDDPNALGEQIAYIAGGEMAGYIGIEEEDEGIEIIVDIRKD